MTPEHITAASFSSLAAFQYKISLFLFFCFHFFKITASIVWQFAGQVLGFSLICYVLELVKPERYFISMRTRLRGLCFMIIYFCIAGILSYCLYRTIDLSHHEPLLYINLQWFSASKSWYLSFSTLFIAVFVSLAISDFFYYWFHRLQHKIPLLWHFHSIHHTPKELNIWSNYHHFTEEIFRYIFLLLPTTLLFKITTMPQIFIFIISLQGIFSHASTKINFGIFRYFILDNRYHRIHHSIEKQHWNKNFASQLPLWDVVFGTAYFPKGNEWPQTGLLQDEEPKKALDYLMRPFSTLLRYFFASKQQSLRPPHEDYLPEQNDPL